ncbi:hypothetical protein BKA64DRAFT_647126 [Cadophora sp. MPI-SDFR-AT-0126]|nr:hypothetical protein BKA64DRAFT_647126 [Leotiomycetes sp. MPI-SDFR-AT-0126]
MVTFIVGPDPHKKTLLIRKHLITSRSPFFKAALERSSTIEGTTPALCLEDIDVRTFGALAHWLYTEDLESNFGHHHLITSKNTTIKQIDFLSQAKLWKLAERAGIPSLQNKGSDDGILEFAKFVSKDRLDTPLSQLAIYLLAWHHNNKKNSLESSVEVADELSLEMLREVSKSLLKQYDGKNREEVEVEMQACFVPLN